MTKRFRNLDIALKDKYVKKWVRHNQSIGIKPGYKVFKDYNGKIVYIKI